MQNLDQMIVNALARKAVLRDQLDGVERELGQLQAIKQAVTPAPAPAPEPSE